MIETVVALLMFVNNEIKEHRIQENMALCLRGKRTAERQFSAGTKYYRIMEKLIFWIIVIAIATYLGIYVW